ncbi:MAG TPA: hypothetical protein VFB71_12685 [Ramlibacter sp.]|nr:hypothetical protein [Ramlibacter sp.]
MPAFAARFTRFFLAAVLLAGASAQAQDPSPQQLAPGFSARAADSRLLVLPADMELFSMSAGGVVEPRADWTDAAQKNFVAALALQRKLLGARVTSLDAAQADEFAEITTLHRAVAEAISVHHRKGLMKLATKQDRLDWSLGDAVRPLKERTGADYALFTWIRDSYASSERKLAMVAMALLGAISLGGEQLGYASLVDLNTGRVVWFNQLNRMSGDLREPEAAVETVEALLKGFPALQQ